MDCELKHTYRKGDHKKYEKRTIGGKKSKGGLWKSQKPHLRNHSADT